MATCNENKHYKTTNKVRNNPRKTYTVLNHNTDPDICCFELYNIQINCW